LESALRDGAGELRLIETMLWDGTRFPRLALHQARLARSAIALGWPAPPPLQVPRLPDQPQRVRVTLDRSGTLTVEQAALPAPKPEWRLALARPRLDPDDPWLRVKSTNRTLYDQARATLPPGIDEVIFLNSRDEVCEGAITTLFFDRGQGLRTPPVTCGLLPGVLRAELAPPEEVLMARDLPHVKLWVGNALRGLIAARLS
jgi:4-amino-4-deoxychorismate lyase